MNSLRNMFRESFFNSIHEGRVFCDIFNIGKHIKHEKIDFQLKYPGKLLDMTLTLYR